MAMIVDSHCHLEYYEKPELDLVLKRCWLAGVSCLHNICVDVRNFDVILKNSHRENIFCSLGTHPCHVLASDDVPSVNFMEDILLNNREKIISVGETGLDYVDVDDNKKKLQSKSFLNHMQFASQNNLPIIVHTRDAEIDTYDQIKNFATDNKIDGVIHCFTGSKEFMFKMLDLGFYISLSGIVTFKNAEQLRDAITNIPLDKLLIETDSPYLAPIPMRGKKNEPSYVVHVANFLDGFFNLSAGSIAKISSDNFFNLFKKAKI